MTTYCIVCKAEIPEKRVRRNAVTCCIEHARELRRQKAAERSERICRKCGRPLPRRRARAAGNSVPHGQQFLPVCPNSSEPEISAPTATASEVTDSDFQSAAVAGAVQNPDGE